LSPRSATLTPLAPHVVLVVVIVAMDASSIWLGAGPVLLSP
jgi:hypothetical protein